jgi:hypothetical protein
LGASQLATGGAPILDGRRQPSCGGTSRMTRECQVRICEGLGVKFPGPTRHFRQMDPLPTLSACPLRSDRVGTHAVQQTESRGRDASRLAAPAQIRTCGFPAYSSHLGYRRQRFALCEPAPLTRLCGSESGACFASPHSPWSPPLAPPAPQRIAPLCSSASQLLWQSPTSRARASSATAPRLPVSRSREFQVHIHPRARVDTVQDRPERGIAD